MNSVHMSTGGGADDLAEDKRELAPAVIIGNLAPVSLMVHSSPIGCRGSQL